MAGIARDHGTTVRAIWNHPANAEHRERRKSPDVIFAGDVLQLPVDDMEPPPLPPLPLPTSWPYGRPPKGLWRPQPVWSCIAGTCVCHPDDGKTNWLPWWFFFHDSISARMPGAGVRSSVNGQILDAPERADDQGALAALLPPDVSSVFAEWAPADLPDLPGLPFRKVVWLHFPDDPKVAFRNRLVWWRAENFFIDETGQILEGQRAEPAAIVATILHEIGTHAELPLSDPANHRHGSPVVEVRTRALDDLVPHEAAELSTRKAICERFRARAAT